LAEKERHIFNNFDIYYPKEVQNREIIREARYVSMVNYAQIAYSNIPELKAELLKEIK